MAPIGDECRDQKNCISADSAGDSRFCGGANPEFHRRARPCRWLKPSQSCRKTEVDRTPSVKPWPGGKLRGSSQSEQRSAKMGEHNGSHWFPVKRADYSSGKLNDG